MFLDVKELRPGGILRFRQQFARDGLANLMHRDDSTTNQDLTTDQGPPQSGLSAPSPAYIRSESGQPTSFHSKTRSYSQGRGSSTRVPDVVGSEEMLFDRGGETTPQYLLICVNQKRLPVLDQINCRYSRNDQSLFQHILGRYDSLREEANWRTSLLFPLLVGTVLGKTLAFFRCRTPNCLEWIFLFFQRLFEASLFKIHTGEYVQVYEKSRHIEHLTDKPLTVLSRSDGRI